MSTTNIRKGFALPPDPLNEVGDPEPVFRIPAQLQYMRTLIEVIRKQFRLFINRDVATGYFHLRSPNGTTYRVTVEDNGTLKVENAREYQIS